MLLALVNQRLQHLALRREPEAVIDELGIFGRKLVLEVRGAAVERQLFDAAMREMIDGAARRFNLDFYCRVFGIESPKSHGVTGMDVNQLIKEEKYEAIAEYCVRDVFATVKLYDIWRERLEGIK